VEGKCKAEKQAAETQLLEIASRAIGIKILTHRNEVFRYVFFLPGKAKQKKGTAQIFSLFNLGLIEIE